MSSTVNVYLDTNVFLEFRPLRDLDWRGLIDAGRVVLVVSSVVLRELQEAKDSGKLPAAKRRRAAERVKWIAEMLDAMDGGSVQLQNGVELAYDAAAPSDAILAEYQLDRTIGDDRLVAVAIAARVSGRDVCVVSDDVSARQQAKICHLRAFAPRDEWRCPAEVDPLEQEIRELKRQVAEYESRRPKLSLSLPEAQSHLRVTIHAPVPDTDEEIERRLGLIRGMLSLDSEMNPYRGLTLAMGPISARSKERYRRDCDRYLEEIAPRFQAMIAAHNARELYVELSTLTLANGGTLPAEAVEVHLHVPASLEWKHELPKGPELPKRPDPPKSILEEAADFGDLSGAARAAELFRAATGVERFRPANPEPQFRVVDHVATFSAGKVKHAQSRVLPKIYCAFESHAGTESFALSYEIHADNLPKPLKGAINIQVVKPSACRQAEELGYEPIGQVRVRRL
jgi:hypothetical protein